MAENTQVAEKKEFTTALSRWSNEITGLIAKDYEACGVIFDEYSRKCAMEAVGSIYNLVKNDGKANMNSLDTSNLRGIVENCAGLKLNPSAYPRECYFQLRNVKRGNEWVKVVEMGIEGAGYDSLLSHYGKDVEQVYPYWVVKEGDTYIPPKHKGLELTPPEWEEKGLSDKAVRVVYPVKLTDGTVTYLTADRASVKVNLLAHVKQNMMNATFGVCEDRYKATPKQKEEIKAKKDEILNALRACSTVDDMLECEIARQFISGAWLDMPESMIQRKMCNNATRKYPKNYDQMARQAQIELDDTYRQTQDDVAESANSVDFDEENIIDGEIVQEV
nr:MAG TPA: RecT family protein [Bacteriophage sp.]